jgi:hypothetical protein
VPLRDPLFKLAAAPSSSSSSSIPRQDRDVSRCFPRDEDECPDGEGGDGRRGDLNHSSRSRETGLSAERPRCGGTNGKSRHLSRAPGNLSTAPLFGRVRARDRLEIAQEFSKNDRSPEGKSDPNDYPLRTRRRRISLTGEAVEIFIALQLCNCTLCNNLYTYDVSQYS